MGQLLVKIGNGDLVISSAEGRIILIRSKSSMDRSEVIFDTKWFLWFDSQCEGHVAGGICNAYSGRSGVSGETSS